MPFKFYIKYYELWGLLFFLQKVINKLLIQDLVHQIKKILNLWLKDQLVHDGKVLNFPMLNPTLYITFSQGEKRKDGRTKILHSITYFS
jgi:hypothetical protein